MKSIKRSITIYESTFVALDMGTNQVVETKKIETAVKPTAKYIKRMSDELHMIHVNTTSKDVDVELPLDVFYQAWKEYTTVEE